MTDLFSQFDAEDVSDLIRDYPLAWVTARGAPEASLLPLLAEHDAGGHVVDLLGHMARRNPLFDRLTRDPRATVLFTGPQGYVSPAHAELRDWGPTWNYAQLTIDAEIRFVPADNDHALVALTRAMEGDRWTAAELGERYHGMAGAIVAFRARIVSLKGRFKLGQDERPDVFAAIARNHPDTALVAWMARFHRRSCRSVEDAGPLP